MFDAIRNPQGELLDTSWHPGTGDSMDIVLLGHGVTANKDRPFLLALAHALESRGIPCLRFSFSGNGESEGRFEDSNITKEVADLGAVLDNVGERRVVYVGHSMGGAVGLLRASGDRRIQVLVSLAGMVATGDFAQRKFGDQTPGASTMWDKPECPLSQAFMDDLQGLDTLVDRAADIEVPWLLVHGTEDTVVPLQDSIDAKARAAGPVELLEFAGADHVFSAHAEPMAERVAAWIEARLLEVRSSTSRDQA